MKLAFRKHGDSHNHTEILLSDGRWATSLPGTGVWVSSTPFPGDYDFIDFTADEDTIRGWFDRHSGDAYDWAAKLVGIDRPNREYCTEAVVLAIQADGRLTDLVAHKTHAEDLYQYLKEQEP